VHRAAKLVGSCVSVSAVVAALACSRVSHERSPTRPVAQDDTGMAEPQPVASPEQLAVAEHAMRVLRRELGDRCARAEVTAERGDIVLAGECADLPAKRAAIAILEGMRGVRFVHDRATVGGETRDDDTIWRDVLDALARDRALPPGAITVSVANGAVALAGTVSLARLRTLAAEDAAQVAGVRDVDVDITLRAAELGDGELEGEVTSALRGDGLLAGAPLVATAKDGLVELRGIVPSAASQRRAYADAWVRGTKQVDVDDVTIDWTRARAETKLPTVRDADTATFVRASLRVDPLLGTAPSVAVHAGEVTLTGAVPSARAHRSALSDAAETTGVARVVDRLHVERRNTVGDDALSGAVANALERAHAQGHVEFTIERGVAVLTGTVISFTERERLERALLAVPDLVRLDDRIEIRPPDANDAVALQRAVDAELAYDARIDASTIHTAVDAAGSVTLTGSAPRVREAAFAREDAERAGARKIDDRIEVARTR
jgi:osmotically-inducible protein OsmY